MPGSGTITIGREHVSVSSVTVPSVIVHSFGEFSIILLFDVAGEKLVGPRHLAR